VFDEHGPIVIDDLTADARTPLFLLLIVSGLLLAIACANGINLARREQRHSSETWYFVLETCHLHECDRSVTAPPRPHAAFQPCEQARQSVTRTSVRSLVYRLGNSWRTGNAVARRQRKA
jgi:hypothetical protein